MNMSLQPPGLNKVEWSMVVPKNKQNNINQKKDPPPPPPYSYRKDTLQTQTWITFPLTKHYAPQIFLISFTQINIFQNHKSVKIVHCTNDNKQAGAKLCQAQTSLSQLPTGISCLCSHCLLYLTLLPKLATAEKCLLRVGVAGLKIYLIDAAYNTPLF